MENGASKIFARANGAPAAGQEAEYEEGERGDEEGAHPELRARVCVDRRVRGGCVAARGRGKEGEGEGEGGGCEGSARREQYEGRALRSSTNTLPSSVSSDANNPKPSVLGRRPSQCRILRYSARVSLFGRGGRLWGVYKPGGGERALTVCIPPPLLARRRPCSSWSCRRREGLCCCCPSCCPYDGGYAARTHGGGRGRVCCRVVVD